MRNANSQVPAPAGCGETETLECGRQSVFKQALQGDSNDTQV